MAEETSKSDKMNNPENIVEGDRVFLKTGNAAMTVETINDNIATCIVDEKNLRREKYKLITLTKKDPNAPLGLYVG